MADIYQALAEVHAANPVDDNAVDTLELYHPAFVDDAGNPAPIYLSVGYEDFVGRIEDGAARNAGEYVTFVAVTIRAKKPSVDTNETPTFAITADNVDRSIVEHIELAQTQPEVIELIYRPYVQSDPHGPQIDVPIEMQVKTCKANDFRVDITATMEDLYDFAFPSELFTTARFPNLRTS